MAIRKNPYESGAVVESYPLSSMQMGMLYHSLRDRSSGVDIEQICCAMEEGLDVHAFKRAWAKVVELHAVLRTSFEWEDVSEPIQIVHPKVCPPFVEQDWRELPDPEQRSKFSALLAADRQAGFDLSSPPLTRFHLVRLDDQRYQFLWTFHHALLDGRSFPIVLEDLDSLYRAEHKGETLHLAERRPFRDYLDWLANVDFDESQPYWKSLLAGFTHPTRLRVDECSRPVEPRENGYAEVRFSFAQDETASLQVFAQEQGVTLNTLLHAGWAILLSRYSGEDDVVFGCTRACRPTSLTGANQMVGLFINTLPIRTSVKPERPLLAWLKELRSQWTQMRPHEHTPLASVQAWSDLQRGLPLFESIVVFENSSLNARMRSQGGSWLNRKITYHGQTNFPITVMGYLDAELLIVIGHDPRRFSHDLVTRMMGHLRTLLLGMVMNPQARIDQVPMLTEAERRELIHERNPTVNHEVHSCLHELFEAQADRRPEAIALVCDGQCLTYGQLNSQANRLAHRLRTMGVAPQVLVGLCVERSNEMVVSLLAINKAGGAYLPIDLAYPPDRLAFILSDAQAPILLTQSSLKGTLPPTAARVVCVDEVLAEDSTFDQEENLGAIARPDDLAYVIYTSGTTGKPKGSLITHRNVVRLFLATDAWYRFDENDVWTLFHSCAFDFSVWEIWGALLYGGQLVVVPYLVSRSPEAFYDLLSVARVTVLNQTPSAFRQLIAAEDVVGQKELALRYVIFGGEALEMQSLRPWYRRHGDQHPRLINMYGITETTVHVTYRPLSQHDLESGSVIGEPIPDLQVYVLDTALQLAPIGVPGEMYVGGAGLAWGYLNRPELTRSRFLPNHITGDAEGRLYKTGDLARLLPGKDIEYLGRIDDQVKIRGFRIELGEIESLLCQHPAVIEAVVVSREETPRDKRLVAYLVAGAPAPGIRELREHLKKQLPEYMLPAAFVFLDKFPLTNNGKIDRQALPMPEGERPELGSPYTAPCCPAEKILAEIWAKVLRVERVGTRDNFFELGGDSILSIQIISLARQAGWRVTPKQLFEHQTIAELAQVAQVTTDMAKNEQGLVRGEAPLTPIQHWFFEQRLAESHHYNQAFLFTVSEPLDERVLRLSLAALERHHDALRLRFRQSGEPALPAQFFDESSESVAFERVDLTSLPSEGLAQAIEHAAAKAQASLNYEEGPLWRVLFFDLGCSRPGRLLLVIHHLAVDGVSWRILIEDLESAYRSLQSNRPLILPAKTTSFSEWARLLKSYANVLATGLDREFWISQESARSLDVPIDHRRGENSEASARTIVLSLERSETQSLLQQAQAAYNTQVNDLLLAALLETAVKWTGRDTLAVNVEGHGREDLIKDVDLSRTVGWFTTIYPVRLTWSAGNTGQAIKSVKEQLRRIPNRGFGYGLHRYLGEGVAFLRADEPGWLFNYLGQFDQVVAGSSLFDFAPESTGPWHSALGIRRHLLELNCWVRRGQLEAHWTYSENFHLASTIESLAANFLDALRRLLAHCLESTSGGATPSDFPLASLDQRGIDKLVGCSREVEDVLPLSPIQTLFFTAAAGNSAQVLDQWHCTLIGPVDGEMLRQSWEGVIGRHSILRTSFHNEGLSEPLQVVHRQVAPAWVTEDWRDLTNDAQGQRWREILQSDKARDLPLHQPPLMRFTLVRLREERWKMLWTVPALLLDGWSWPLVFRDLSQTYDALRRRETPVLAPVRPYRDYLAWLQRWKAAETEHFWRGELAGFHEPTPLLAEVAAVVEPEASCRKSSISLSPDIVERLSGEARRTRVTANAYIQAAWSITLARLSGERDIVFGAAFAGRPTELSGAESIVGPFVNNLPVRVRVDSQMTGRAFLQERHTHLLGLAPHQFVSLNQIHSWSAVPWHRRLFESLLVVQNYSVDSSARRLGAEIAISDFDGPIHTRFPLLVLVEPGDSWTITAVFDQARVSQDAAVRWLHDLQSALHWLVDRPEEPLAALLERLTLPVSRSAGQKRRWRAVSQNVVPPQTDLERAIVEVWRELFQLHEVGVEDNVFDLGAHSLLMVRMHQRLRETLGKHLSLVALFQYPTIRSLSEHLSHPERAEEKAAELRQRGQLQREALARARQRTGPSGRKSKSSGSMSDAQR